MSPRLRISAALIGLVALVVVGWLATNGTGGGPTGSGWGGSTEATGSGWGHGPTSTAFAELTELRPLSELPAEAAGIWELIRAGGPFEHEQDGRTFGNREGLLPPRPGGYYREYTVPTPGAGDRGARRLVAGDGGELYYTGDHYRSFVRVDPER